MNAHYSKRDKGGGKNQPLQRENISHFACIVPADPGG